MRNRIAAAILAGGPGIRMQGLTKPNILIAGETVIFRTLNVLKGIFNEIIIVTNSPGEFLLHKDCIITKDNFTGIGPLGGIHAALKITSGEALFILAGDMPLLNNNLIKRQIDLFDELQCDILVPKTGNLVEPLHSVYRKSVLQMLEAYLREKRNCAVREFVKTVDTRYMELDESEDIRIIFSNINFPSDITAVEKILSRDKE